MKKKSIIALAVVTLGVLAAAYPATAWFFGKQIETAHRGFDEKLKAMPYIKLIRHDYERGIFGANEAITIEVPGYFFQTPALPALPGAEPEPAKPVPPVQLTLKTVIQHGPLPGLGSVGAGQADTTLDFDAATQALVKKVFGESSPLVVQSRYRLLGGGHAVARIAPFKVVATADSPAAISSPGMTFDIDFTEGMKQQSVDGLLPSLEITGPTGQKVVLNQLRIVGQQRQLFDDNAQLYVGDMKMSLAEIKAGLDTDPASRFLLKDFLYEVDMPVNGEYLDLVAKIGAGPIEMGDKKFASAHYDFSIRHLHARKFADLYTKLMAVSPGEQGALTPEALAPLKAQVLELVVDNLAVTVDRLSLQTADGEANLHATLKLPGATTEDFANPMGLIAKLELSAEFAAPLKMLTTLQPGMPAAADEEEATARKQKIEQFVAGFVGQGYATNENGTIKTKASFRANQLLVNDKPFNPAMMAAPQALSADPASESDDE